MFLFFCYRIKRNFKILIDIKKVKNTINIRLIFLIDKTYLIFIFQQYVTYKLVYFV